MASESGSRSSRPPGDVLVTDQPNTLAAEPDEPPIVARLVVEIRSDGTRVIARGAIEDAQTGQKLGLEARGATPVEVAGKLMKTLMTAPMLAREAVRGILQRRLKRGP